MNKLVIRTVEGFIRKLEEDGLSKYATELRSVIAMSRKRRDAFSALSNINITLLTHLIKYISMPQARDRNKWRREIRGYLFGFNIKNKSPKGLPWLSLSYIQNDLNDILSDSGFIDHIGHELENFPDKNKILSLLKTNKSLKSFGIKFFYDTGNKLNININDEPL
jgi:hypothetical protein